MKSGGLIIKMVMIAFLSYLVIPASAQVDSLGYITVSGVIKNSKTKKELSSVNIFLPSSHVGTVTNDDGYFNLKLKKMVPEIVISHLGYKSQRIKLERENLNDLKIMLVPHTNLINEIVVLGLNPAELIEEALDKVSDNYSKKSTILTGFYRETAQKGKKFINVSEAVINIFKTPYKESVESDRVQILKGRRLLSQKASDTLGVKLMGGPTLCIFADVAKNRDSFLSKGQLQYYNFRMEEGTILDGHQQYVISFYPKTELPNDPLFIGKAYIDKDNLAFSRIEFSLDMSDKYKATRAILYRKPLGLRFNPQEMSYVVNYKIEDGISYLNYIRNSISFKCDWKKRLFSKGFTVVSEMVVTDQNDKDVVSIPRRDSFDRDDAFYDKVANFNNDNFWEDYNIIEPTESLEHAVNKLKKQQK